MNRKFEEAKHFRSVKWRNYAPTIHQGSWALGIGASIISLFGVSLDEDTSFGQWIVACTSGLWAIAFMHLLFWFPIKFTRVFIEFREKGVSLSGQYVTANNLVGWSFDPEPTVKGVTIVRIVHKSTFGSARFHWSMLMQNEAEIADLKILLQERFPQVDL